MGMWQSIRAGLGSMIGGEKLREAIASEIPQFDDFADRDEHEFRSIRTRTFRDVTTMKRERVLQIAYWLYLGYPIARRALEIMRDFVVGEGMSLRAEDKRVQEILDEFWNHSTNAWNIKQFTRVLELGLYGEQFYPVSVNPGNGFVTMGYIDPLDVFEVHTDPHNVERVVSITLKHSPHHGDTPAHGTEHGAAPDHLSKAQHIKPAHGHGTDIAGITLKAIQPISDPESDNFGRLDGEVFFFAINKVANATRGNSDLLNAIDWIETHDQFLFGVHEAAMLKTAQIWDVTVEGGTPKQMKRLEEKYASLGRKKGMVRFHNDKVTITSIAPELDTQDLEAHAGMIKRHILSGLGFPEHWFSEGGSSNRATAAEMGIPTTKMLRSRQRFVKNMMLIIGQFVIDQAKIKGRLPKDADERFIVVAPQIWANDTREIAASMVSSATALSIAVDRGWINDDEASDTFRFVADQLGFQITKQFSVKPKDDTADQYVQERWDKMRDQYAKWKKENPEAGVFEEDPEPAPPVAAT